MSLSFNNPKYCCSCVLLVLVYVSSVEWNKKIGFDWILYVEYLCHTIELIFLVRAVEMKGYSKSNVRRKKQKDKKTERQKDRKTKRRKDEKCRGGDRPLVCFLPSLQAPTFPSFHLPIQTSHLNPTQKTERIRNRRIKIQNGSKEDKKTMNAF